MSNKGYGFEIETLNTFQALEDSTVKKSFRVYGSGRNKLSKNLDPDADLDGDVRVKLDFLDKNISVECKHYKPRKKEDRSISVKKEWVDTNLLEAEQNNEYSLVAIKFKNTSHNSVHYILPKHHFIQMMEYIKKIKNECVKTDLRDYSVDELLNEIKIRCQDKKSR